MMSKEVKRLTRWILGCTQPKPYSLDISHPAMEDIAHAADYIQKLETELERVQNELIQLRPKIGKERTK